MKINLPVLKDEDTKDASHLPELEVGLDDMYHRGGCQDHALLAYTIWSLQGYLGELVRSSGMDITLDNVFTIIDKHYNNVKVLDALNQELFQLQMADKETVSDWGVHLLRHLQVLAASFRECFPPLVCGQVETWLFYGGLPKCLKAMVPYLRASPQEKTYSNYLWAAREAEKEDSMELSQRPQSQATNNTAKPKATSFFPLQKHKKTQPALKAPTMHLAHLEEESTNKDEELES